MGRVCGKHDSEEKGVPDVIKLYYTHFGRSLFVRFWNLTMENGIIQNGICGRSAIDTQPLWGTVVTLP